MVVRSGANEVGDASPLPWTGPVPEDEVDHIFQALADTTRRDILGRSMRHEESVSALARHYDMSFAAVQKHVAVLERAELVTKQRHGREQLVHGNANTVRKAQALLGAYQELWAERTIRIADILAGEEGDRDDPR